MLNLPISSDLKFDVMGNGETLKCKRLCLAKPVQIQERVFLVDFHILPI